MILDINLLPKKLNEINYFKKIDDGCEIYSYNERLEQRNEVIVVKLPMEIENDFCVDSKAIEMIKRLNPAEISITNKNFIIKSSKGKFTSRLLSESLFDLSQMDYANSIIVDFDKLLKASGYVSKNEKKPVLCGVTVCDNGDIYATDSFKAYCYEGSELKAQNGITLPINFINLIKNTFNKLEKINIMYNNNIALVEENNIKIYSRLIDGNYPNMEKIFSNIVNARLVNFDIDELRDRIEIASNIGVGSEMRTIIKLTTNKIEAMGNDNYEASIKFENDCNFETKLQLEIFDQALKTMDKPNIKIAYNNEQQMGIMVFITNEDESEISLILCVR